MVFPCVVVLVLTGAMLLTGGQIMDSEFLRTFGWTFWGAAVLLLLRAAWIVGRDAWNEWQFRRWMRR